MVKKGAFVALETTDFVDAEEVSENKLVSDAEFVLVNIESKRCALFFVEMDMGTERIVSHVPRDVRFTLHYKIAQYDRYLKSRRSTQTYAPYGEFRFFTLLFVTLGQQRVEMCAATCRTYQRSLPIITASQRTNRRCGIFSARFGNPAH